MGKNSNEDKEARIKELEEQILKVQASLNAGLARHLVENLQIMIEEIKGEK